MKDDDHIPTQRHGMIPLMRCEKKLKHGDIKRFRLWLNFKHASTAKHRHRGYHQDTREYGDYLYGQDRDKFQTEMLEWLATGDVT